MGKLENKVSLVTGANSGIGEATVLLFAQEGSDIVLVDVKTNHAEELAQQIRDMGRKAIVISTDVTKAEQCDAAVQRTIDEFGKIDVLVNCAGILDYNRCVSNMDEELWDRTIAINQSGVFYLCRAALRFMEVAGTGSIVNVSSMAGLTANSGAAYSTSKHAVIALSKNIALQYSGTSIRCNVVCPGRTATPMNSDMEYFKQMDHPFMEICGRHTPRFPDKIPAIAQANAILFFASDDARYVNGQWLAVDDGASKNF